MGFRSNLNFWQNAVLNQCQYLTGFYTYDKNKAKKRHHHFSLKIPKIIELVLMVATEKRGSKT